MERQTPAAGIKRVSREADATLDAPSLKLAKAPAADTSLLARRESSEKKIITRDRAVRAIFRALDASFTGRVAIDAMLKFATLNGFDGSSEDWAEEYNSLCREWQVDAGEGFDEDIFAKLVNDKSEKGCFCSDQDLRSMFQKVFPQAGPTQVVPDS